MKNLILRQLNNQDESAFFEGLKEWEGESLHWYTFSWKPGMTFSEMLLILENEFAGIALAAGRVPHSMLYGFVDGKIIGRVSIRHTLNEHLRIRGGHIGYAVAKPFRKEGYATEMLRQALDHCRELKIPKLMITCADDNIPSWKIIEKFNGKLDDKIWDDEDKEMIRRYWIALDN
jgi:predicted acetyltransferase